MKRYGWYSIKAAYWSGVVLWSTPTGETIECTCITDSPTEHHTEWADIVCVGEVVDFISSKSEGRIGADPSPEKLHQIATEMLAEKNDPLRWN